MKNLKSLFALLLVAATNLSVFPWGQKGHDVTCYVAQKHLTPSTHKAVTDLLDGKSIVYYANWLDNASNTPEYRYTKTWHYKNIDANETFENAPLLETGDVVRAIREQVALLSTANATKDDKALALKILVHLVGDVHQPMHMGHRDDRGGNKCIVKFFNAPTNLHSLWDSKVVESAHKWGYTEWQEQIDTPTADEALAIIKEGTPEKWGKETYLIASQIYETTPSDKSLSYDYINKWTPVIEDQFLKGGLRLADLLNSIFDPEYKGENLIIKK